MVSYIQLKLLGLFGPINLQSFHWLPPDGWLGTPMLPPSYRGFYKETYLMLQKIEIGAF